MAINSVICEKQKMEHIMKQIKTNDVKKFLRNKREICVFVGAGASILPPSCLPSFQELNQELLLNLSWSTTGGEQLLPVLRDIHVKPELLLQILWDHTDGCFNPVECFQMAEPNQNHHLIAELAAQGVSCVITPNFDPCLEKALQERHIPFTLFPEIPANDRDAKRLLSSIRDSRTVVWKPHGDCERPQTLCYTKTKVAKLRNSRHLRELLFYIIQNYHLLFLGYSGYDDDFFPILYDALPHSKYHVIWNAYHEPEEHAPCLSLQKEALGRFHLYIGDMTPLLQALTGKCGARGSSVGSWDWKQYLERQLSGILRSKKMAMLAKYLHDLCLDKNAEMIWREGLCIPEEQISEADRLRFQMNLGVISQKTAYEKALELGNYYIAEIALENLIIEALSARDSKTIERYLREYFKNSQSAGRKHFKRSKYDHFLYRYKLDRKQIPALQLQTEFDRAYQELCAEGELSDALQLILRHYGALISNHHGNEKILKQLFFTIEQLIPYGDQTAVANAYYYVANLAISMNKWDVAYQYHKKCIHAVELCRAGGIYQEEQCHELWAYMYHQSALIAREPQDSLKDEYLALAEAEQVGNELAKARLKGVIYNQLCILYTHKSYKQAVRYGMEALKYGRQAEDLQTLARTYTYLAVADAKYGLRREAVSKFRKSYALHQQIQEKPTYLYSVLEEYGIGLAEIL